MFSEIEVEGSILVEVYDHIFKEEVSLLTYKGEISSVSKPASKQRLFESILRYVGI